ncbi:hypothetical protein SNE40_019045 [Patella caerulea]|uniref:Peroxisomal membrane protein PMP34 n=1 Tax=Patella caerulea TaxID=87958 RepID=A0AAN8P8Y7_PATCE
MTSGKWMALSGLMSYSNLVHAVAGAVGSVVALTVFFPLDTARTRLQVDDQRRAKHSPFIMAEIAKDEGLSALYRGLFPVVSALCCSNFVYFYVFNGLKAVMLQQTGKVDPLKDLTLAFVAGVINVIVTTPLWVVNTRLRLQGAKLQTKKYDDQSKQKYNGIVDCIKKIIRYEGARSLWNGTMPSIVLASNPAIQFMVYETLKRYFQRIFKTAELSGVLYFIMGAIAKAVSTVITYPLQVLQSRMRAGFSKEEESKSMLGNILHLISTRGIPALYKGMEAKLLQTVLTAALMFLTYEKIAAFTFRLMGMKVEIPKR